MRIGLFTDTYRPSINGITFVVESLKRNLEANGHEVFIFCPARKILPNLSKSDSVNDEDNIIRFPSIRSGFFDDFDFTIFFPPKTLRKIQALQLDVIHVFTPSQVGLLGINAAVKYDIPLVVQHSTDLYEFVEHYPSVLPGALALVGVIFPMSVKLNGQDIKEIIKLHRPRMGATKWNREIIAKAMTMLYSKSDAVISLSRKSQQQLVSWQDDDYSYEVTMMPNGVNALPVASSKRLLEFRQKWGFEKDDEVFGFVGRLGEEKNLTILIEAMDRVGQTRPNAKLLFVGDFDYRETLEELAANSRYPDRIVFTGAMPREELGVVYETLNVFVFPSLKDTQGWVLHEAAQAKRPIVLIDRQLSEVAEDGVNGFFAENDPGDLADKICTILADQDLQRKFGENSKRLAMRYTEKRQIKKLEKLYQRVISEKGTV